VTKEAVVEMKSVEAASAIARPSSLMRAVNNEVREAAAPLHATEPIGFFCECRRSGCFAVSWLTAVEFDARLSGEGWILVSDHEPSEPWARRDDQSASSASDGVKGANDLTHAAELETALTGLAEGRSQSLDGGAS
jgi:hypothetical protein